MKKQNLKLYAHRLFPEHMKELKKRANKKGISEGQYLRELILKAIKNFNR